MRPEMAGDALFVAVVTAVVAVAVVVVVAAIRTLVRARQETRVPPGGADGDAADETNATALYDERLVDIGADSPMFTVCRSDSGVWFWCLTWTSESGVPCFVEHEIPDDLLKDDEEDESAPDLHDAVVAGRAAVQGFCEAYAEEDPVLAAILDALLAEEDGDDAVAAAAAARLTALYAAADGDAG